MQRRTLLAGIGSIAAGGAAVIGTGAFTQVSANRDVTVSVADDSDSRLAIRRARKSDGSLHANAAEYVVEEGDGTLALDLSNLNQDGTTIIDALLDFKNLGTQPINVGEVDPSGHPGSFYAEGQFGDGQGDSFDVDDWDNSGQVVSTGIGAGETLQNVGYFISNPEDSGITKSGTTFEVTFQATRVGGDRV
jgi:hypothetical protein